MIEREAGSNPLMLRFLVTVASVAQVIIGSFLAYRLLHVDVPDLVGLVASGTVILAGLSGLFAMFARARAGAARAPIRTMNMVIAAILIALGAILIAFQYQQGLSIGELLTIGAMGAVLVVPFLVNSVGLAILERREEGNGDSYHFPS
jgi:hypothetical protein